MRLQHRPQILYIYRTIIQQRLLVEFSCEFPTLYPNSEIYSLVRSLDIVSSGCYNIRHVAKITFPKSSSSLTPSMWLKRYLMIKPIRIKSIQQLSLANFSNFLLHAKEILLNFGNALANSSGDFTDLSTKIQNCSILSLYSQVKYFGIIAKNLTVTTSTICGK